MITPSPEDYGFVQVERPVIQGGREFLVRAALVGRQVLGTEIVASVTEFGISEVDESEALVEPEYQVKGIARDVMRVGEGNNDLRMVLLHRGTPAELASRCNFGYHGGLLAARRRVVRGQIVPGESERGKHIIPGLTTELNKISRDEERDPHYLPIVCDRISILDEPGKDLVLGLLPIEQQVGTLILHKQAKAAFSRLAAQSRRLAYPAAPSTISIPFARIPGNIRGRQYERLIEGIQAHLPHTFTLGGIVYTAKD